MKIFRLDGLEGCFKTGKHGWCIGSETRHNGYDMTPPIPHNLNPVDDNTTLHCLQNLKPYTENSD